jgi:hypothetical protein
VSGDSNQVQNVFLSSVHQGRGGVSMSRTGHTETAPNGDRFIVLEHGRRYEARIETRESAQHQPSAKEMTTAGLLRAPTRENLAELVWRLGAASLEDRAHRPRLIFPHLPIRRRMSCMRWAKSTTRSAIIRACTIQTPIAKSSRPCATRAWITDSRFEYTM